MITLSREEQIIANTCARLGVTYTICRTAADLSDESERSQMKHNAPKKYPCADTRCRNYTDRPNSYCEECHKRQVAEWRELHVPKNDPRRRKP
jgi:hypothetical protein